MPKKISSTLCWDCGNAIGNCRWSSYGKPVLGWTAEKVQKSSAKPFESYIVIKCPEFKRDAWNGGLIKYEEGQ